MSGRHGQNPFGPADLFRMTTEIRTTMENSILRETSKATEAAA